MAELTNIKSPRVKAARRLTKRAFRDRDRAFLAEGPQAVREALALKDVTVELFTTVEAETRHADIVAAAVAAGVPVHRASGEVMSELTQTVTPQGLLAVCRFVHVPAAEAVPRGPGWWRSSPMCVIPATRARSCVRPTPRAPTRWCSPTRRWTRTTPSACGPVRAACSTCRS
ncbi:hypothetical protein GCM10027612_59740 [Microbispora bryophytorum subsp. camponoti]